MAGREPGGIDFSQRPRSLKRRRPMPGRHAHERETRVHLRRRRHAAERRVGVGGVERAVTCVEERNLPGCVTGRCDHLQRANAVARREGSPGPRLRTRIAPTELPDLLTGVERLLARHQARVTDGDRDLGIGELLGELVERPDVVAMGMRQSDPHDWSPARRGLREHHLRRPRYERVDQREAVVLLDEIAVDEPEARDAGDLWHERDGSAGSRRWPAAALWEDPRPWENAGRTRTGPSAGSRTRRPIRPARSPSTAPSSAGSSTTARSATASSIRWHSSTGRTWPRSHRRCRTSANKESRRTGTTT